MIHYWISIFLSSIQVPFLPTTHLKSFYRLFSFLLIVTLSLFDKAYWFGRDRATFFELWEVKRLLSFLLLLPLCKWFAISYRLVEQHLCHFCVLEVILSLFLFYMIVINIDSTERGSFSWSEKCDFEQSCSRLSCSYSSHTTDQTTRIGE